MRMTRGADLELLWGFRIQILQSLRSYALGPRQMVRAETLPLQESSKNPESTAKAVVLLSSRFSLSEFPVRSWWCWAEHLVKTSAMRVSRVFHAWASFGSFFIFNLSALSLIFKLNLSPLLICSVKPVCFADMLYKTRFYLMFLEDSWPLIIVL